MKYLNILLLVIIISSCGNSKKVAENTSEKIEEDIIKVEETETVEIVLPAEDNSNPTKNNAVKISLGTDGSIDDNGVSETIETYTIEAFNHEIFNNLLKKHVSSTGNVNYKGFKTDIKLLRNYINTLSMFMPKEDWTKQDKLAYWINAYNAMTIDLIIQNYPIQSIKDIKEPWEQRLWKLGEKWYNLDEIEHQISRKMNEPRIHFAIVCASYSCPKLQNEAYTAAFLEAQFTKATKEFLTDSKRNSITENNLKLSKIFKWFKKDFEQNGSLIDFLNTYSEIKISEKAKKSYLDYNWDLND